MLPASEALVLDSYALVAHLIGQPTGAEVLDFRERCFALALAQSKGLPVLTGDPEFAMAEALVPIRWLNASP